MQSCEEIWLAQARTWVCMRLGHCSNFTPLRQLFVGVLVQHPVASLSLCFPRQLMENQIGVVERGAFDDMKELERL